MREGHKGPVTRLGDRGEVRTAEECVHGDVDRDNIPVFISKRWSITRTGETIKGIPGFI